MSLANTLSFTLKKIRLSTAGLVILLLPHALSGSEAANADDAWNRVDQILAPYDQQVQEPPELRKVQFRDLGLEFYKSFPSDRRRWDWLCRTIESLPRYFKDPDQGDRAMAAYKGELAVVDTDKQKAWDQLLVGQLQPAFLASAQVTDDMRGRFLLAVANAKKEENWMHVIQGVSNADFSGALQSILDCASGPAPASNGSEVRLLASYLFDSMGRQKAGAESERAMVAALSASPNSELKLFASALDRVIQMRERPMSFRFVTLEGQSVDLRDLHGKVVYIDIWATSCGGCIAAMPMIRAIYDRYHDRGFEVVGICLLRNEEKDKAKAGEILRKQEAKWLNGGVSGQQKADFVKQYAILGVPVTWLLDKNGQLVGHDISLKSGLEIEIRQLLGLPPLTDGSESAGHPVDRTSEKPADDRSTTGLSHPGK